MKKGQVLSYAEIHRIINRVESCNTKTLEVFNEIRFMQEDPKLYDAENRIFDAWTQLVISILDYKKELDNLRDLSKWLKDNKIEIVENKKVDL